MAENKNSTYSIRLGTRPKTRFDATNGTTGEYEILKDGEVVVKDSIKERIFFATVPVDVSPNSSYADLEKSVARHISSIDSTIDSKKVSGGILETEQCRDFEVLANEANFFVVEHTQYFGPHGDGVARPKTYITRTGQQFDRYEHADLISKCKLIYADPTSFQKLKLQDIKSVDPATASKVLLDALTTKFKEMSEQLPSDEQRLKLMETYHKILPKFLKKNKEYCSEILPAMEPGIGG